MSLAFLFHYLMLDMFPAVNTSETCRASNNEIKKQVTSSWSIFIEHICKFLRLCIVLINGDLK